MRYKYKGITWDIYINKPPKGSMRYWTWSADSSFGSLSDSEGGELGDMNNARRTIEGWIRMFMDNPMQFKSYNPYIRAYQYMKLRSLKWWP